MLSVLLCFLAQTLELFLQFIEVLVGKFFKIDKFVSRSPQCAQKFIQFQMDGFGVAILRVLNEEHHQERHDGRPSVDDQLPCVRKMEVRAGQTPNDNNKNGASERPGAAENSRRSAGENAKDILHGAEQVPRVFLFF